MLVLALASTTLTLPRVDAINEIASTRWLKLQTLDYTDQSGRARKWDMATRTTKTAGVADAVVILPLLRRAGETLGETIVVEQYRPPIGAPTVELPAGLIDAGESPQEAALRELKEETGYTGTVSLLSEEVCMSPGLCDETVQVVVVDVDLDAPENRDPAQQLDPGEFVVVRRVPLDAMREVLDAGAAMPIEGLYLLAIGLEVGRRSRIT